MRHVRHLLIGLLLAAAFLLGDAHRARSGPPTPVAATTTFVLWPGGIADPATSVFTDWTDLYVAASAVTNPHVVVDDRLAAAVVPAGGPWALDGWTLENGSNAWSVLHFADGAAATLCFNLDIDHGLTIQTEATTTPTFTATPGCYPSIFLHDASFVWNGAEATQPFFYVPAGGYWYLFANDGSVVESLGAYDSAGSPLVKCDPGGLAALTFVDQTTMGPGVLAGAGRFQVTWTQTSAAVHADQPAASAVYWYSGPATTATFAARETLAGTTDPQTVPAGRDARPTLASESRLGVLVAAPGVVGDLRVVYFGDAADAADEVAVACYRNGVAVPGLAAAGLPAGAGSHVGSATLALPVLYDDADVFHCEITTGALAVPLRDVQVVLGNHP